jgi:hypothetical protein
MGWLRNIYYGITNIIRWLPIIYRDRDWDYDYIYILLYYKFKNMEKLFTELNESPKIIKEIKTVKCLCKRLIESNYLSNEMIPIEQKYGKFETSFNKTEDGYVQFVVKNETEEYAKARGRAYRRSEDIEQQDTDMLFTLLNKKIRKFWN